MIRTNSAYAQWLADQCPSRSRNTAIKDATSRSRKNSGARISGQDGETSMADANHTAKDIAVNLPLIC